MLLLLVGSGCGRVGYDELGPADAPPGSTDAGDGPGAADAPSCLGGTRSVAFAGHCYHYVEREANLAWLEAKTACEELGGTLAAYASAVEEQAVVSVLAPAGRTWIGANDLEVEGAWGWITGEPFDYTNWRGSEPNNQNGAEDCGSHSDPTTAWLWNDLDCDGGLNETRAYLCEVVP